MTTKQPTERDILVHLTAIMRGSSFPTSERVRAAGVLGTADDESSPVLRDALAELLRQRPDATVEEATAILLDTLDPDEDDEDDEP